MDEWIQNQMERIVQIIDKDNYSVQFGILMEIIDKVNVLDAFQFEQGRLEKYNEIKERGVEVVRLNQPCQEMKSKWMERFASGLSDVEKVEINTEGFLWHVFSFEKVKAMSDKEAERAFHKTKKSELILFFQNREEVLLIKNAGQLKASDFELEDDVYLVDKDFCWTYIHTHEIQCGPYFLQN